MNDPQRSADRRSLLLGARTKTDAAYEQLRAHILDGTIPPGSALDQGVLARDYEISTTPIREALRRLEAEQLVVVKPHHGLRVSPLSPRELQQLYEVRLELDPLAGALAAKAATDPQRAMIRDLARHTTPDVNQRVKRNREFHRAIYEASGNPELTQILESLWNRCERYRFLLATEPQTGRPDHDEDHLTMANALEAGDSITVRNILRTHTENSYLKLARLAQDYSRTHANPWE